MTGIAVLGAGAFGTALAISLAQDRADVVLWSRNAQDISEMKRSRVNHKRLPTCAFPQALSVTDDLRAACEASTILLAIPMQQIARFVETHKDLLWHKTLVCCCKGIDLDTQKGPVNLVSSLLPDATVGILSGPSFAIDIAQGLPTALTIASSDPQQVDAMQALLSTRNIRLYSSVDPVGVEFGGALKNVIAIACGIAIGAGLGESARAALMTRGYSEMQRLAVHFGADAATLSGLSGFGDLVLTCTSTKSRNFAHGLKIGEGLERDGSVTVEGVATSHAVAALAQKVGLDMPITTAVHNILSSAMTPTEALEALLSRPLKKEYS